MCYHVSVGATYLQLEEAFDKPLLDHNPNPFFNPKEIVGFHLNGFNFPKIPIITSDRPEQIQLFNWGLIPKNTKDFNSAKEKRTHLLNARSESIFEKPIFWTQIKQQRCLVIASGFFEWQQQADLSKIPYYIHLRERKLFAFAGIYDYWINEAENSVYHTFSILTREANSLMARIHNTKKRMPVILDKNFEKIWIDPKNEKEEIKMCFESQNEQEMESYTISKLITSRNQNSNVAEVLKPYSYERGNLFD